MKNTSKTKPKVRRTSGLKPEYRFDYTKAKANRFAQETRPGAVAILLDPDVARVFKSAESVNTLLLRVGRDNARSRQTDEAGDLSPVGLLVMTGVVT